MCHRNSVMMIAFTPIVSLHGRSRSSHRRSHGRSSMTAPIDQTPPSRKHTVGG
jgi:hypothetical protein